MPAKGAGSRPGFIDPQRGPRHADPYHDTGGARRTAIPALPALAHHSNSAYQVDEIITLTGTVEEWRWYNPRTWLLITVEGEDGTEQEWAVEGRAPGVLGRAGLSAARL